MMSITHPEFGQKTNAAEVASAFASSVKDRIILITGVNPKGLGFAVAEAFAAQSPRCLILAGRSESKVQESIDALRSQRPDIDYRALLVDLSSQRSVRDAAAKVLGWNDIPTIDIVINNAAAMNIQERTLSPEGLELHFATNHIGHFLLTNLLMPKLIAATKTPGNTKNKVRIINISSIGVFLSAYRASDPNFTLPSSELPDREKPNLAALTQSRVPHDPSSAYFPFIAYGHSKTCNVLFSVGLNSRLHSSRGILSLAVHPGEIQTELTRHTDQAWLAKATAAREKMGMHFWKSPGQGASTVLVAALDPGLEKPDEGDEKGKGYFLNDCQIGSVPGYAVDGGDAEKLWEVSEGFVGEKFEWS